MKLLGLRPWDVINSGYGVPTREEFEKEFSLFLDQPQEELKASVEGQRKNLQNIFLERISLEMILPSSRQFKEFD